MSNISTWSETAANNNAAPPDGMPEGMYPSAVNDAAREMMAAVRRWTDDGGWHNWGHTYTYNSATSFTVATDVTAIYHVGRRVRAVGSSTGTIYGTISAVSYALPNTTVTVTWDSGTLYNETLTISVGFLAALHPAYANTWASIGGKPQVTVGDPGFPTLDSILAASPTDTAIVVPAGTHTLDASSNRTLSFGNLMTVLPGAAITIPTGRTFTIDGSFTAGLYQVFAPVGTGKVKFGQGSCPEAYPEWWGAVPTDNGTTDCAAAINAALAAHVRVKLQAATYYIASSLYMPAFEKFLGTQEAGATSTAGTYIKAKTAGTWLTDSGAKSWMLAINTADGNTWTVAYPLPGAEVRDMQFSFDTSTNVTGAILAMTGGITFENLYIGGLNNGIKVAGTTTDLVRMRHCSFVTNGGASDYDFYQDSLGDGLLVESCSFIQDSAMNGGLFLGFGTAGSVRNCIVNKPIFAQYCYGLTLQNLHMETYPTPTITLNTCHATLRDIFLWKSSAAPAVSVTYTSDSNEGWVILDNVQFMVMTTSYFNYTVDRPDVNMTYGGVSIRDCARIYYDVTDVTKKNRGGIRVAVNGTNLDAFNNYSHFYSRSCNISQDGSLNALVTGPAEGAGITNTGSFSWTGQSSPDSVFWSAATNTYYYDAVVLQDPVRRVGRANAAGASAGILRTNGSDGPVFMACGTNFPAIIRFYRGTSAGSYTQYVDVPMLGGEYVYDFGSHVMGFIWQSRSAGGIDTVVAAVQFLLHGSFAEFWGTAVPNAGTWTAGDRWWKSNPAGGTSPGSICTTGGSSGGTWKTMANLGA